MTCTCGSVGADSSAVRLCNADGHFRYWRGDKRLTGVGSVIKQAWPIKPSWDQVDPAVIENARDRGAQTDDLFSGWLNGTLTTIPAGTRRDAVDRFLALRDWWPRGRDAAAEPAKAQIVLADDELVGVVDVIDGYSNYLYDLKNTASVESTYTLQLGGYVELYEKQFGMLPRGVAVIHVTQPKDRPVSIKILDYSVAQVLAEWRLVRQFWGLVVKKANGKLVEVNEQ